MKIIRVVVFILLIVQSSFSQKTTEFKWWNPSNNEFDVLEGQGWPSEVASIYDRLPARLRKVVTKQIWNSSRHSTGLSIRFWSNADTIRVNYKVKNEISNKVISPSETRELDLYSKSINGEWLRYSGKYKADSIINCEFNVEDSTDIYKTYGREFQLFLPLSSTVEFLEIGINKESIFNPLPIREERPIVVYGESLYQEGETSSYGMAWANILQRKLERPLINLGFLENDKLETELIDLITKVDAKLYILDCSSNLKPHTSDVFKSLINAVEKLRIKRPKTPIIITNHSSFLNVTLKKNGIDYKDLDEELNRAFNYLKAKGILDIYLLKKSDFSFNFDSNKNYIHSTKYKITQYAQVFENLIRKVLVEPKGDVSTTIAKTQSRDIAVYNWVERHQKILKLNKLGISKICLFGDSIINFWGGEPETSKPNGQKSWEDFMEPLGVRNYGFGYDYIENVLWRIQHDELDGVHAEKIVFMIGTNNLSINSNSEIIDGLIGLVKAVKERSPNSMVFIIGVLPRQGKEDRIVSLNHEISQLKEKISIDYYNINAPLLNKNGKVNQTLFSDGLHPNNKGYSIIAKELQEILGSK